MELSITLIIVVITVLVSIGAFNNQKIMDDLIFHPPAVSQRNQWYRFFSAGLVHADVTHLAFNMISLYLFGRFVEQAFLGLFAEKGKLLFLAMYILALPVSLLPTYFKNRHNYHYYGLGASGAVSAVVFAGLLLAPTIRVGFFLLPPIIPGYVFAPLYVIISVVLARKGGDNINHSAHIWGAVVGLLFVTLAMWLLNGENAITNCLRMILADLG
ncbi:MAG: rhomboid family intramembrane serine protease [Chitinophagaceae bacterium]|jgi:membrane associated rhomboid family serine protease|nr:rhomboid family intramembrane serine protease [Chitinophagaceae bacterium]